MKNLGKITVCQKFAYLRQSVFSWRGFETSRTLAKTEREGFLQATQGSVCVEIGRFKFFKASHVTSSFSSSAPFFLAFLMPFREILPRGFALGLHEGSELYTKLQMENFIRQMAKLHFSLQFIAIAFTNRKQVALFSADLFIIFALTKYKKKFLFQPQENLQHQLFFFLYCTFVLLRTKYKTFNYIPS